MARQILYAFLSALIAVAQTVATGVRMVWKGGRWIAESFRLPQQQAPAAAASAADALAALAEVTETPAPEKAEILAEPIDPFLEWGNLAQRFAISQSLITGEDEPRLDGILDEPAIAWLTRLPVVDLLKLTNANPRHVGQHMLGERQIPGLSLCPTLQEWEQSKRELASITVEMRERLAEGRKTIQDALDDLIADPAYVPCRGI